MRKRLTLVTALLGGLALAAGTVPAFTADNGSVLGTVNVPEAAQPCLTLGATEVDFGTQAFSDLATAITPIVYATPPVHLTACSTALENVFMAASDATTASGGTWDVPDIGANNTCEHGLNVYQPHYSHSTTTGHAAGRLYNQAPDGTFYTQLNGFQPMPSGFETDVSAALQMPCAGSAGAGETVSMTFSFLAVLA